MTFRRTRCPHCKGKLEQGQRIHPDCIAPYADAREAAAQRKAEKQARMQAKVERAETRRRKEAMKSRGEVLAEAKVAVQAVRRLEELAKGRGCISCGRSRQEVESGEWRPGGYWDGGHFQSKGAHPELALEPKNIWLQCKSCNAGSSKYAGKGRTVNAAFEANLIALEGQELVDWLKGPHPAKHYDIEQLREIRDTNRAQLRAIQKEHT